MYKSSLWALWHNKVFFNSILGLYPTHWLTVKLPLPPPGLYPTHWLATPVRPCVDWPSGRKWVDRK